MTKAASADRPPESRDGARLYLQQVAAHNPFEEALAQLARAIRLGAVPVGGKFPPERELSELLGVSRSTVREAIRGLEQAGYITTRRGRSGGTFVISDEAVLSAQDRKRALGPQLLDTLDFRQALEPGAVALAATKADAAVLERIQAAVAATEDETDPSEFVRRNCRLHILFAEATACRPLIEAVTTVELETMDALLAMPDVEPTSARSHTHHHQLANAIEAGEPDAAREVMDAHLAATATLVRELLFPDGART